MGKLRVLDLFSGIGGFSLGLERTGGFETVAFCEIEDFPRRVLAKHWPGVPCYDDVRTLTGNTLRRDGIAVDVITGGFPCQDISIAGRGKGLDGARSGLWHEYPRLVREMGYSGWIVLENVTRLLSLGLATVLQNLCEIGYNAVWHCVPASAVGSVQNRDRIWIVAHPCEDRVQGFFESFNLGQPRQGRSCRQEDLQQVYNAPLNRDNWPQPLICGGRGGFPNWVDRIASLGNSIDPAIAELIGRAILKAEERANG